jgi:hypothetical protein
VEGIGILEKVKKEHDNPASARDLHAALELGLGYASSWGVKAGLPVDRWRVQLAERDSSGPNR